jgi:hypothetical protein
MYQPLAECGELYTEYIRRTRGRINRKDYEVKIELREIKIQEEHPKLRLLDYG